MEPRIQSKHINPRLRNPESTNHIYYIAQAKKRKKNRPEIETLMNCDCMRLGTEMERKRMSEARGKREKRSRIISETLTDDAILDFG